AVREPHPDVGRREPEGAHHVDRERDDLGVPERPRLPDQVAVELEVLPQPPALLPLVAEELGDGEPADRLLERVGPRRHHPREGRGHLRPKRDAAAPLVLEAVELARDLGPALGSVELQRLERGAVVLLEPVARRHRPPGREDMVPEGEVVGVEVAKSRQGGGFHGRKINRNGVSGEREARLRCRGPLTAHRSPFTVSIPSSRITSPTVWNDPVTSAVPAARYTASIAAGKLGIRVQVARAGGRSGSRSQRVSHSMSHPRLAAVGAMVSTPRSITWSSCTSISGHSLSPRIETSAWRGRGGASSRSAATSARIPSGLWATSNSHRPRRSSRPG